VEYREGIFVGYRGFEKNGTKPLFPFGHGLSYTTFRYGNLAVRETSGSTPASPRYDVTFDVTNTGDRAGAAVAQVYVADRQASVPRPPKELKGFSKVMLQPGETRHITVPLDLRSFAYYDANAGLWRAEAGDFEVLVGSSSADIAQRATLTLARTATTK
jgi:beta-glucosidase